MSKQLATMTTCCCMIRIGVRDPDVMHSANCALYSSICGKLGQTIALCDMAQVVALEARVKELEDALEFIRDAKDDGESAEGPVVNVVFLQEQARSVLTPDNRRQDAEEDGA